MRIATWDHEVSDEEARGPDQEPGTRDGTSSDRRISELFRAYFNNKMTLVIFLIQAKTFKGGPRLLDGVSRFLDDLYHHMLTERNQEEYRAAFEWLKSFFRSVPDVSEEEREQAKGFIRCLYRALGMNFKETI